MELLLGFFLKVTCFARGVLGSKWGCGGCYLGARSVGDGSELPKGTWLGGEGGPSAPATQQHGLNSRLGFGGLFWCGFFVSDYAVCF